MPQFWRYFFKRLVLQAYLSHLLCEKPGNRQAIEEIEEIIQKEHPLELIRLVLYQQLIHLYKENQEPKKAVQYGLKFEKLLVEMNRRENLWEKQSYGEFNEGYVKNPERLYNRRIDCAACALELQDWENAEYFLKILPWQEENLLCRYYPAFEQWRETYGHPFTSMVLEIFANLNLDNNLAKQSTVDELNSLGKSAPIYILMLQAFTLFEKERKKEAQYLYMQCMEQAEDFYLQQILLCEALRNQIELSSLAIHMNLNTWDVCAEKAVASLPFTLTEEIQKCTDELLKDCPLHRLSLKKWIVQQRLLKGFLLWDGLTLTLKEYCQCILEFYKSQYREEMFDKKLCGFLPNECRFAMTALSAMDLMEQEQLVEAVRLFRECIQLYPPMTGVINELLRQAMRRANNPALHSGAEFQQLAGQLKETLHTLIDAGQTMQAAEILNQLLPLMPEDTDLIRMRLELIKG